MDLDSEVSLAVFAVVLLSASAYFLYLWYGVSTGDGSLNLTSSESAVLLLLSVTNAVIAFGFLAEVFRRTLG